MVGCAAATALDCSSIRTRLGVCSSSSSGAGRLRSALSGWMLCATASPGCGVRRPNGLKKPVALVMSLRHTGTAFGVDAYSGGEAGVVVIARLCSCCVSVLTGVEVGGVVARAFSWCGVYLEGEVVSEVKLGRSCSFAVLRCASVASAARRISTSRSMRRCS